VTKRQAQSGISAFGGRKKWWTGGELNSRHRDFQSRSPATLDQRHVPTSATEGPVERRRRGEAGRGARVRAHERGIHRDDAAEDSPQGLDDRSEGGHEGDEPHKGKPLRVAALVSALVGLVAGVADAHPHVFIDYAVTLVVSADRVAGVRLAWMFDDLFSGFILQEFDQDRNGALSTAEVQRIEEKHLAEFHKAGYYTTVNVNGKPVTSPAAREFRATVAKGIVTYEFTLPLGLPLTSATALEVLIDDPVYYIAYTPVAVTPQAQTFGTHVVECRVARDKTGATPDAVRCGVRRR
jgi:ABC-type uncharacterized transport system substrate-binding protein